MNPTISKITMGFCLFAPIKHTNKKIEYNLTLTDLTKKIEEKKAEHFLIVDMHFDLMKGVKKPNLIFQVCYQIIYSAQQEIDFEVIKDHIAIAHIIPHLRELVANLTTRADYKPLILPPLNTLNLYNQYLESKNKQDKENDE